MLIAELVEAVEYTNREKVDEDMLVEEEGGPGCGLMLRHTGNNLKRQSLA